MNLKTQSALKERKEDGEREREMGIRSDFTMTRHFWLKITLGQHRIASRLYFNLKSEFWLEFVLKLKISRYTATNRRQLIMLCYSSAVDGRTTSCFEVSFNFPHKRRCTVLQKAVQIDFSCASCKLLQNCSLLYCALWQNFSVLPQINQHL